MKRLFSSLSIALLALSALPVHAATLAPGDLIKGPNATVYYYGQNGQRYVFPTPNTYFTWYSDFSSVKTLTASELALTQSLTPPGESSRQNLAYA